VQSQSLGEGALSLMSSAGVGKMKPNIVLLGFMHSWKTRIEDDIESYYNIIHDALTLNYGVGILNIPEGTVKTYYFQKV
jgi:solute carrier family 12 sodium/potassium/chloride transporter 2